MKLGDKVKDRISGWEGRVTVEIRQFNGTTRFDVAGSNSNGEPASYMFDEPQLEVVEPAPRNITPTPSGDFELGDRVKEKASGWEGNITAIYLYSNGCVRYEVQGANKQTGCPEFMAFDEAFLEKVNRKGIKRTEKKMERTVPARTGGAHTLKAMR